MAVALPKNQDTSPGAPIQTSVRTTLSTVPPRKSRTQDADFLAHDAHNWLTVLQVYCDLLRTSGAVASGYQKWIDELSGAVERGHELVASLLDSVQRSDHAAGKATAPSGISHPDNSPHSAYKESSPVVSTSHPVPLDVADAITRRLPLLENMAGGGIQIEIDTPANAGKADLPESSFERILQNLVRNAIEAMPDGGRLRVALRSGRRASDRRPPGRTSKKSTPKTLLLCVSDTGDGIAPERLPHIFEAGVSSKTTGGDDHRPRGFGLAIVRELTQRAGGTVRVQSDPGRGSCFEIELPRV